MILLDTHIWFRWQNNNDLPINLLYHIEQTDALAVSAISCCEIAQLVKRKRIDLPISAKHWIELASMNMEILPINKEIALLAEELANHHKDPADRFIIATSIFYQLPIMSLDTAFPKYLEIKNLLIN